MLWEVLLSLLDLGVSAEGPVIPGACFIIRVVFFHGLEIFYFLFSFLPRLLDELSGIPTLVSVKS